MYSPPAPAPARPRPPRPAALVVCHSSALSRDRWNQRRGHSKWNNTKPTALAAVVIEITLSMITEYVQPIR